MPSYQIKWRTLFDNEFESETHRHTNKQEELKQLREEYLLLWSTFEWDRATEQVKIWMRKDVAHKVMGIEYWSVGVIRRDIWMLATRTGLPEHIMKKGRPWKQ